MCNLLTIDQAKGEFDTMLGESDDDEESMCLISYQPLDESVIRLTCGHSFNYLPLFKEIVKQKRIPNFSETTRLRVNQMKCPYCRTVHGYILPYLKLENVDSIRGVNIPLKYGMKNKKCTYVFRAGKRKGDVCNKECFKEHCPFHMKYTHHVVNDTVASCETVITRGPRKGMKCGRKMKKGVCSLHSEKSNNAKDITVK
jgi:hypothetical protein